MSLHSFSASQSGFLYGTLLGSMFAGASVVHAVLAPDLRIPQLAPRPPAAATGAPLAARVASDGADGSGGGLASGGVGGSPLR